MHPFEFALAALAIIFLFKFLNTMMLRKGAMRHRDTQQADAELLARLNQVEERVRVLERIVTDERFDLKQQFKDLGP